jgi:aryl-alcohol dehydrogenase-like predicted oxidoreductase
LTLESRWPKEDWRSIYFGPENLRESVTRAEELKKILPQPMTLPEMAIRFILSNKDVSTTIPGMRRVGNVEKNVEISSKGPLSASLIQTLRHHRWDRKPASWGG